MPGKMRRSFSYWAMMALIIIFAVSFRIVLLVLGWLGAPDSDEATMGIMALHIAYDRSYPLIFYGQGYMGTFEAYIAAVFFHIFGPSGFSLRLGLAILYAPFLFCVYLLTQLLYTRKLAIATIALLSLSTIDILYRQLEAAGGHPETPLFAAILMLLACRLTLFTPAMNEKHRLSKRVGLYCLWAFLAGFALWDDSLIVPWIAVSALLLFIMCRQDFHWTLLTCVLACFFIGISPLIVYNLSVPLAQSTFGVFSSLAFQGHTYMPLENIVGTLMITIPTITGANPLCPAVPHASWAISGIQTNPCLLVHLGWGIGYVVLLILSFVLTLRVLRRSGLYTFKQPINPEHRLIVGVYWARLCLMGGAGMTLLFYVCSSNPALWPWASSRYLVTLALVVPAVLWLLWHNVSYLKRWRLPARVFSYCLFSILIVSLIVGSVQAYQQVPADQAEMQKVDALTNELTKLGATRIYSEYWTCNRLIFFSQEHIICSVLDAQLQPGLDRYLPYRAMVKASPHPAYIFPTTASQNSVLSASLAHAHRNYRVINYDDYTIYLLT